MAWGALLAYGVMPTAIQWWLMLRHAVLLMLAWMFATAHPPETVAYESVLDAPRLILKGHSRDLWCAVFSPDGTRVLTASTDMTARLWDSKTGSAIAILRGHTEGVRNAIFDPSGKIIVTVARDGTGRLWNAADGTGIATLTGHTAMIEAVTFSPDVSRISTG